MIDWLYSQDHWLEKTTNVSFQLLRFWIQFLFTKLINFFWGWGSCKAISEKSTLWWQHLEWEKLSSSRKPKAQKRKFSLSTLPIIFMQLYPASTSILQNKIQLEWTSLQTKGHFSNSYKTRNTHSWRNSLVRRRNRYFLRSISSRST